MASSNDAIRTQPPAPQAEDDRPYRRVDEHEHEHEHDEDEDDHDASETAPLLASSAHNHADGDGEDDGDAERQSQRQRQQQPPRPTLPPWPRTAAAMTWTSIASALTAGVFAATTLILAAAVHEPFYFGWALNEALPAIIVVVC